MQRHVTACNGLHHLDGRGALHRRRPVLPLLQQPRLAEKVSRAEARDDLPPLGGDLAHALRDHVEVVHRVALPKGGGGKWGKSDFCKIMTLVSLLNSTVDNCKERKTFRKIFIL